MEKSVSPAHGMITFHGRASMEILSIGRISQTRKIAALCGKEGKIVMKRRKVSSALTLSAGCTCWHR